MTINTSTGLIDGVTFHATSHCEDRPVPDDISLIVIHNISMPDNVFGNDYIRQLFMGELNCDAHPDFEKCRGIEVSAHVVIDRNGAITQYVPFHKKAWHAGRSIFDGREACNDYSIGIELEGGDNIPYTDAQYDTLTVLVKDLMQAYPLITPSRITGHSDIAPGRKTDPGPAFDWARFQSSLKGL